MDAAIRVPELRWMDAPSHSPTRRGRRLPDRVTDQDFLGEVGKVLGKDHMSRRLTVAHVFINIVRNYIHIILTTQRDNVSQFHFCKYFSSGVVGCVKDENFSIT